MQTKLLKEEKVASTHVPARNPHKGWAEAAAEMVASGDDKLLIPDVFEDEKFDEWTDCAVNLDKAK